MEFYYLTNNKGSDNLNYNFLIFSQDLDIKLILNWANQQKKMVKTEVIYVNIFVKYTALYKVYIVFHAAKNQRGRAGEGVPIFLIQREYINVIATWNLLRDTAAVTDRESPTSIFGDLV